MTRGRQGKFELKRAEDGQFYFVLKAGNGQVLMTSETYTRKANAMKGVRSAKANILGAICVVDLTDTD